MTSGQSDSFIVLRDGRADHMGKERTERPNEHSKHASGRTVPNKSVSRTLLELKRKAEQEPKHRFRSLYREIDLSMLYESFRDLKRKAAPGVDGVTVEDYEKDLDSNLRQLLERLVSKTYRAQNVRRRYIPKGKGKTRPLGIPALEDKIVQQAASKLLQAIYEVDFLDESKGYRPGRGARDASQELREKLFFERVHWVVEADIKSFFDHVDHDWLERMLEERVDDKAFIRLIRKWLKAGVLEETGEVIHPATGTPQGGIICFAPPPGSHPFGAAFGWLCRSTPFTGAGKHLSALRTGPLDRKGGATQNTGSQGLHALCRRFHRWFRERS